MQDRILARACSPSGKEHCSKDAPSAEVPDCQQRVVQRGRLAVLGGYYLPSSEFNLADVELQKRGRGSDSGCSRAKKTSNSQVWRRRPKLLPYNLFKLLPCATGTVRNRVSDRVDFTQKILVAAEHVSEWPPSAKKPFSATADIAGISPGCVVSPIGQPVHGVARIGRKRVPVRCAASGRFVPKEVEE